MAAHHMAALWCVEAILVDEHLNKIESPAQHCPIEIEIECETQMQAAYGILNILAVTTSPPAALKRHFYHTINDLL